MILVIYLVEAENQDLFIVGKEVIKHSIEFFGSDIILLHVVVGYRSRNHICNAVEIIEEWLHSIVMSEQTESKMTTTQHIVMIVVKYRHNDVVFTRDNLITVSEPTEYLYW